MEEPNVEKEHQEYLDTALMDEMGINNKKLKKLKKKLAKVNSRPDRGIETWFRLASRNLYTRLQIVDTKGNILITTNAIIISVVLGSIYPSLQEDPHLIIAVTGLILTNVFSIIYAILATIPPKWQEKTDIISLESADLMTFEDFSCMNKKDYQNSVMRTIQDGNLLYPSIANDIHQLGVKLAKKYRLIRLSYLIFLYGIIVSVVLFGVCHSLYHAIF
jgi:hypothetical protein